MNNINQKKTFSGWFNNSIMVEIIGIRYSSFKIDWYHSAKSDNENRMAYNINYNTLYLLFCKDHDVYSSYSIDNITSYHLIKSEQDKKDVFRNFFKINYINRIP